jgi:two-component system nitrogen regulation response regulator GlnG
MVESGDFRSDLYYRLSGFTIQLAPLRERRDDIVSLLERYLLVFSNELGKDVQGISPEALELLLNYSWPGNVRELQNVLKQTLLRSVGSVIIPEFLPDQIRDPEAKSTGSLESEPSGMDLRQYVESRLNDGSNNLYAEALEFMERYLVTRVLGLCDGNQSSTASRVRSSGRSCEEQSQFPRCFGLVCSESRIYAR